MRPGSGQRIHPCAGFPDDKFRHVVRPNADTLVFERLARFVEGANVDACSGYCRALLFDATDGRLDETITVPGKRTTAPPKAGSRSPDPVGRATSRWRHPNRLPTNMAWIIGRTQTNSAADYKNVHAIQAGYRIMPLSRYPDGAATTGRPAAARSEARKPPPIAVASMSNAEFFHALC